MTSSLRKRPSPASKKRHHKLRQRRIAARRRQVPMGGNRGGHVGGTPKQKAK